MMTIIMNVLSVIDNIQNETSKMKQTVSMGLNVTS